MEMGVVFPTHEIGKDAAAIRDFGQAADELGYTRLVAYEHILGAHPDRPEGSTWLGPYGNPRVRPPYTHETPFHEPFVLFGYLAAVTSQIEFMTGVLVLPLRQTALVAKQCAEIDIVSGGRLVLGVGVGWNSVEFEALGENFKTRGRRMEEQIGLLKRLWTEPVVTFEGRFDRVTKAGLNPMPDRSIPIWVGAMVDTAIERAGRLANGWHIPRAYRSLPEVFPEKLEQFQAAAKAAGRDPASLGVSSNLHAVGLNMEEQLDLAERSREAGITHLQYNTLEAGLETPGDHLRAIRDFAEQYGLKR